MRAIFVHALLLSVSLVTTSCLLPPSPEVELTRSRSSQEGPAIMIDPAESDPCESLSATQTSSTLSGTCLYAQGAGVQRINPFLYAYEPQYQLWSDGALKDRHIYLPRGTQIDTSNMEGWIFPVGTRIWKEFAIGPLKVETRLLVKVAGGSGLASWSFSTYQWRVDGTEADLITAGATDTRGTPHNIPSTAQCSVCHQGATDAVLGFDLLQLSQIRSDTKGTAGWLASRGIFTVQPPTRVVNGVTVPGTDIQGSATTQAAFGYLYGNCAHCHNPLGRMPSINFKHNLSATAMTEENAYLALVPTNRVTPDSPATSRPIIRMNNRTPAGTPTLFVETGGMPPIASEIIDPAGIQAISDWINNDI